MRVSVIIATYGDRWWEELALERAFPSAHDQGAHEIIVGHDTHLTIGPVRNVLAEKATGDWLCFLDADDELAPGYLDAMAAVGGENVLLTPAVSKVRKGRRSHPTFYPEVPLWQANWLIVGTLLRRDLFKAVGGFNDEPHGFEDWTLWAKCAKAGARVVKVPKAVYIQHVNPQSKHRLGWRDRRWQVETHQRVERELAAWTP
jgi:glycosyltransferase involved in cell wall biosynthesis